MPAQIDRPIGFEIRRLLQEFFDLPDAFIDAPGIKIVNLIGGLEVAEQNIVAECGAIFRVQHIDVFLGEEKMTVIEQLQIALKEFS